MKGIIFAFERQDLHQKDKGRDNLNEYYKRRLNELLSSLSYLCDVNILLGKGNFDPTYLNQFLFGDRYLNETFINYVLIRYDSFSNHDKAQK